MNIYKCIYYIYNIYISYIYIYIYISYIYISYICKGSCVVVWDREDNLAEGYKHLSDSSTYVEVKNDKEKLLVNLTEKSNKTL